jgi:predicted DNA-binding transcriptional regulator AlpA
MFTDIPRLLNEAQLTERLNISKAAARRWRLENRGPQFIKLGRRVLYPEHKLVQWLESRPSGGERQSAAEQPTRRMQ